jgi:hypothetical protein
MLPSQTDEPRKAYVVFEYYVNGKKIDTSSINGIFSIYRNGVKNTQYFKPIDLYTIDSINLNYNDTFLHVEFSDLISYMKGWGTEEPNDNEKMDIEYITLDKVEIGSKVVTYYKTIFVGNAAISFEYK